MSAEPPPIPGVRRSFGLSRGVYRVRVVHNIAGTQARVIVEEDVTVN